MKEESLGEITLRKYEKPYQLPKRELAKKVCLSIGLLQPGDSRDIVVDILLALMEAKKSKQELDTEQIKERAIAIRKEANLELRGIAESNIRRQLKRLRDIFLVEKNNNLYRIAEFESLGFLFESKLEKFYIISIVERIREYLDELDKV
ncbi:MAG: hypothetical protein WC475_04470 [Candidatus Paceibacterota bacterium]